MLRRFAWLPIVVCCLLTGADGQPQAQPTVVPGLTTPSSQKAAPTPGLVTMTGFLRRVALPCPPCPEGAECEPCPEPYWLAEDRPAHLVVEQPSLQIYLERKPARLREPGRYVLVGELKMVTGHPILFVSELWQTTENARVSNGEGCAAPDQCGTPGLLCRPGEARCLQPTPIDGVELPGICVSECEAECVNHADCSLGELPGCCPACCPCPSLAASSRAERDRQLAFCATVDCMEPVCGACPPCPELPWPEEARAACVRGECVVRY